MDGVEALGGVGKASVPNQKDLDKIEEIKEMYINYPATAEWMLKAELYYRKRKAENNV